MNNRQASQKLLVKMAIASAGVIFSTIFPAGAFSQTPLGENTQQAMIEAINDEYRARAFYRAVIKKFGPVRPFTNIVRSEGTHVNLWNSLFAKYRIPVPSDTFAGQMPVPDTLAAACKAGADAEVANVEMYDRFLEFVTERDLRAAFTRLRQVSSERHLPAFRRCLRVSPRR